MTDALKGIALCFALKISFSGGENRQVFVNIENSKLIFPENLLRCISCGFSLSLFSVCGSVYFSRIHICAPGVCQRPEGKGVRSLRAGALRGFVSSHLDARN